MIWRSWGYQKLSPCLEVFIFDIFEWVCLFPTKIWSYNFRSKWPKMVKIFKIYQKHQKIKNIHFFSNSYHRCLILYLNMSQINFHHHMINSEKKNILAKKNHAFENHDFFFLKSQRKKSAFHKHFFFFTIAHMMMKIDLGHV